MIPAEGGLFFCGAYRGLGNRATRESVYPRLMTDIARRAGPALEAHQQFILWLVPTIERFPRSQKFLLGDRIQATALDVLEALVEATYTRDRRGHLARANLGLEKLRVRFRAVAVRCRVMSGETDYETFATSS
jgi:hypothetical protein